MSTNQHKGLFMNADNWDECVLVVLLVLIASAIGVVVYQIQVPV